MSGANYHISYCQILESERRLKVYSILKLYQSSTEQISIHEFISKFSECPDSEPSPPDVSSQVIEVLYQTKLKITILSWLLVATHARQINFLIIRTY